MTDPNKKFNEAFWNDFSDLLALRRDVRHFTDQTVDPSLIQDCLKLANLSPSVGLSQPWRFIELQDPKRRQHIISSFEKCNGDALAVYEGADKSNYAKLKLEGLQQAPVQLAVFSHNTTPKGKNLGKMTMPEMSAYSVVTAIYAFWLAARARGLGVGWVSILDPQEVTKACDTPDDWQFIAYLCVGWPKQNSTTTPELVTTGWETRDDLSNFYKKL